MIESRECSSWNRASRQVSALSAPPVCIRCSPQVALINCRAPLLKEPPRLLQQRPVYVSLSIAGAIETDEGGYFCGGAQRLSCSAPTRRGPLIVHPQKRKHQQIATDRCRDQLMHAADADLSAPLAASLIPAPPASTSNISSKKRPPWLCWCKTETAHSGALRRRGFSPQLPCPTRSCPSLENFVLGGDFVHFSRMGTSQFDRVGLGQGLGCLNRRKSLERKVPRKIWRGVPSRKIALEKLWENSD